MNFTDDTAKALALSASKGVKFFVEGEPEQLYMAIVDEPDDDAFQIRKSGAYFYAEVV